MKQLSQNYCDGEYDSGNEGSGKDTDWNMEPGDPGWLGG